MTPRLSNYSKKTNVWILIFFLRKKFKHFPSAVGFRENHMVGCIYLGICLALNSPKA